MNIDKKLYRLPFIGSVIKRLYSYFKKNTAFTDFIHIALGLGIGLIIAGNKFIIWGIILLFMGIIGHIYAFIKGRN